MSRSLLALAALTALALLAFPATAQTTPGGSITISGLNGSYTSNQTQLAIPITVQLSLNSGTCVGGSNTIPVTVTATKGAIHGNATVSVDVSPATINFQVQTTNTGAYTGTGGAVVLVKPGLVRDNVTVPITVTASAAPSCALPAGQPGTVAPGTGSSTLHFVPVSEEVANSRADPVPGFELPVLLGAVLGVALLLRRRSA